MKFLVYFLLALALSRAEVVRETELNEPLESDEEEDEEPWETVEDDLNRVPEAPRPQIDLESTCPCVRLPGSSECLSFQYDKTQLANSLEEALINFRNPNPNPLGQNSEVLDEDVKTQLEASEEGGESEKRKRKGCCQKIISSLTSFAKNLRDSSLRNITLSRAKRLRDECKIASRDRDHRRECKRADGKEKRFRKTANYRDMTPQLDNIADPDPESQAEMADIMVSMRKEVSGNEVPYLCRNRGFTGQRCRKALRKADRATRKLKKNSKAPRQQKNKRRGKRQTASQSGESWPADCNYRRGADLDEDLDYVGFCNLCWSWRILDSKYYPSFINELSCDSSDGACLAGWGSCRPRWRSIQVMYNSGTDSNPSWQRQSLSIQVACECRIKSGSPLHNFVSQ